MTTRRATPAPDQRTPAQSDDAVVLAHAVGAQGKVIAVEKAEKRSGRIRDNATRCKVRERVEVKIADALTVEHAPVRENCTTCHDPHGSSNDRMLAVRLPMLCQRCHIATRHPATIYDNNAITVNKSNRMFGRSCVNCHSNIHGSNHPSGQFFMR